MRKTYTVTMRNAQLRQMIWVLATEGTRIYVRGVRAVIPR